MTTLNVVDITLSRGDTGEYEAAFNDVDGAPIDDDGAEYRMTAKFFIIDSDADAAFSVTAAQYAPGLAILVVPPAKTTPLPLVQTILVYDVRVTETGGRVTTIQTGRFIVNPDVSQTTP